MLRNTFCHLPGVGLKTERRLWASGIQTWDDLLASPLDHLSAARADRLKRGVSDSIRRLEAEDGAWFQARLPGHQQWRMFPEFSRTAAYLDIETTGLGGPGDYITTVVVYDGDEIRHFVHGDNLPTLADHLRNYRMLITYNGKCFDIPFIRQYLGIAVPQAHIDLRYVLAALGYRGGLKGCEKQLGLARDELEDVDGFFAVLLWFDHLENGNPHALETLLAYNALDVVNLSALMVLGYNGHLSTTPFLDRLRLPEVALPEIPFRPHAPTIQRLRGQPGWGPFS